MGLGLLEQAGQRIEDLQIGRDRGVIKGHVMLFLRWKKKASCEMGPRWRKNNRSDRC
jgi:hypothetical protein